MILYEYFKILFGSKNILKLISKHIKSNFFMSMNDIIINKNDELKYLILMKENFAKYKKKMNFFLKWKNLTFVNQDKDNDSLENSIRINNNLFKSMNNINNINNLNNFSNSNEININNENKSYFMDKKENNIFKSSILEKDSEIFNINNITIWKNNLKINKINNFSFINNIPTKKEVFKKQNFYINNNIEMQYIHKDYNNKIKLNKNFNDNMRITKVNQLKIIHLLNKPNETQNQNKIIQSQKEYKNNQNSKNNSYIDNEFIKKNKVEEFTIFNNKKNQIQNDNYIVFFLLLIISITLFAIILLLIIQKI